MANTLDSDFEWYTNVDLRRYIGKWVAILNKQVIASDKSFKSLMKKVEKKHPQTNPLITKVPSTLPQIV